MTNLLLISRLESVRENIRQAAQAAGRPEDAVTLLAVSKTKPLADIVTAYGAGQRHFAENYAQEAVDKRQQAPFNDVIWHFIGPLQSNKTRMVAEHCDWVHTIDRLKIAQRLSDQRPPSLPPLNVLIQVNISDDPAKAGVKPDQVERLAEQVAALPGLELRGLMAIPAVDLSDTELLQQYQGLKKLQQTLITLYPQCTELSIGMSGDFAVAIAAGATMVRIGSDIFGNRN